MRRWIFEIVPSLNIADKGLFISAGQLAIGLNAGEEGEVTVSDTESSLKAATFIIGGAGRGTLKISNGAVVENVQGNLAKVGTGSGSGTVTISDTDSRLSVGELDVGGAGQGVLNIFSGALVKCSLGKVGGSSASGSGSGIVTITHGLFTTSEWHVFGNCDLGIDGRGTISLNGAGIGPTAKLTVDANLTIGSHGLINGNGTISAGQTIHPLPLARQDDRNSALSAGQIINNGIISPGLPSAPGTIEIDGNFQQGPSGAVRIEVAGLDAGKFNVLQINGEATLAGRVELAFIQGFVPKVGDTVEFLKVNGKAAGTLDVVPLIVHADSSVARPALLAQAKLTLMPDGKGSLTVTDVRPAVQLNIALDPIAAPQKANLSFTPIASSNHFVEFRDGLAAGSVWQQFPGAPHYSGIISDSITTSGRLYRVRVEN